MSTVAGQARRHVDDRQDGSRARDLQPAKAAVLDRLTRRRKRSHVSYAEFANALPAETAGHVAVALRAYRRSRSHNGIVVPAALAEIEREMSERAMRRQEASPLEDLWTVVQATTVTPAQLTIDQAAQRLQCSARTVERRIAAGSLRVVKDGRLTRIRVKDLDEYIDELGN
jgi:excisionase family DNA binding protein